MTIFSLPAKADPVTIAESSGIVTGIDNLTINGITYDVLFVDTSTPTITFTSFTDASTAVGDIVSALNSSAVFPNFVGTSFGTEFFVPFSPFGGDFEGDSGGCAGVVLIGGCVPDYANGGIQTLTQTTIYAEFTTPVSTPSPEPPSLTLMPLGIGLLAFTLLIQKRRARELL